MQQGIIRAQLTTIEDEIQPGLRGTIVLALKGSENQLALSQLGLGATPLGPCVWRVEPFAENPQRYRAKEISVQILGFYEDKVFVSSPDLKSGEKIAMRGQFKLSDNTELAISHV